MEQIDRRRHYVLVLDTETANTIETDGKLDMSNVLFYDCGWAVVDTAGNTYKTASYVNRDVFCYERELMQSAYYAKKIPQYVAEVLAGKRIMADQYEIHQAMIADMTEYRITEVVAHNARFDTNALNGTQRYVTKSKYRWWFPYGTEIWCTMRMAQDVILPMPTYRKFCEEHGYLTSTGKPKKTAEILYRFITGNNDFIESHTGLEDVEIEKEILFYCYRQHKAMPNKVLYARPTKDIEEAPIFYYLGKDNPLSVEETLKKVLDKQTKL